MSNDVGNRIEWNVDGNGAVNVYRFYPDDNWDFICNWYAECNAVVVWTGDFKIKTRREPSENDNPLWRMYERGELFGGDDD